MVLQLKGERWAALPLASPLSRMDDQTRFPLTGSCQLRWLLVQTAQWARLDVVGEEMESQKNTRLPHYCCDVGSNKFRELMQSPLNY